MRAHRAGFVGLATLLAASASLAQVGRGGSQWLTALADAQRTSWIRTDDKISVAALSKPGFELQWKTTLGNRPRGLQGLAQGVTASGVTLFIPMSLVAGSSNRVYGIDNDLGYLLWERQFDLAVPAATSACPGGMTSGATRIVPLDASATSARANPFGGGRGNVGYRSLLGEPGQGVPVEGRIGGPAGAAPPAAAPGAARGAAPVPAPVPPARGGQVTERIPGSPRKEETGSFLGRPSGVVYVVSSDGMLHVLGLPSGKDIQKPAPFLPANSKWSAPIGVGTMLYAATSGACGGAPNAVWSIDLDSDAKPVTSWNTNGGGIVGAMAFTSDGTLIATIGAGQSSGDSKSNAVVALDPKTLQLKDWFTHPTAEFVTGPTILRHGDREIVAAATKDGRVLLLNASSLGGPDHATPLVSSRSWLGPGATVGTDALAAWQQSDAAWILLPVAGRVGAGMPAANGSISAGAVVALKIAGTGGTLALEAGWVSHDLTAPGTPIIVNGVVFTLATGVSAAAPARGTPAVLHAYDGVAGRRLWTSGKAMSTVASPGSFWSGLGQIYVGAHDGTLYAFGFNDERRSH